MLIMIVDGLMGRKIYFLCVCLCRRRSSRWEDLGKGKKKPVKRKNRGFFSSGSSKKITRTSDTVRTATSHLQSINRSIRYSGKRQPKGGTMLSANCEMGVRRRRRYLNFPPSLQK